MQIGGAVVAVAGAVLAWINKDAVIQGLRSLGILGQQTEEFSL